MLSKSVNSICLTAKIYDSQIAKAKVYNNCIQQNKTQINNYFLIKKTIIIINTIISIMISKKV